ncbi:FeoB-associated Cys-rich membrane protein [Limosilactobacillus gorillae]|jgi:hypothetical protein|uniref:FeoB-associated Cys-rich membrane protein n=1 Tax=Limosilactobacillus gorillae TaxID=1450649 RepID=UPI000AA56E8A
MISLITNTVIILLIVALAFWQLVKVFKRAKKGKCAACDYDCAVKKQVLKQKSLH